MPSVLPLGQSWAWARKLQEVVHSSRRRDLCWTELPHNAQEVVTFLLLEECKHTAVKAAKEQIHAL